MPLTMFDRLRIRLALWIAPKLPNEVAIEKMTEVRRLALIEAAEICEMVSEDTEGEYDAKETARACRDFIHYRAEHSEMFADELRRRSA